MSNISEFINRFRSNIKVNNNLQESILVDSFGDSPELSNMLLDLVLAGTKTATCTSLFEYQRKLCQLPKPGTLTVILDGKSRPRCVIETTEILQKSYKDVTVEFAREEGEHQPLNSSDELILQQWRDAHWAYFQRVLPPLGYTPTKNMIVLCEKFRVIYSENH